MMVKSGAICCSTICLALLPVVTHTWIVEFNPKYYSLSALKSFEDFKLKFHKIYSSLGEENVRRIIYTMNKIRIEAHNRNPNRTFDMGYTSFMDMTVQEFTKILGTHVNLEQHHDEVDWMEQKVNQTAPNTDNVTIDYETDECNGPVENQLSCGSCWAFSTTQIAGWLHCKKNGGNYVNFSKQQLVDCSTENQGCVNGYTKKGAKYIKENGITAESDYPYANAQGTCEREKITDMSKLFFPIRGTKNVKKNDEEAMKESLREKGPLLVVIDGTDLAFYKKGVVTGDSCNHGVVNHAVLLVGKVVERDGAWKLKNHWGPDWGEDGYFYLEANNKADKGCLGVAGYPSFAF